jgi:hypothetical protein
VSTVDDIDSQSGRITSVLALQELVAAVNPGSTASGRARRP